jgi:hypothetical protein
MENETMSDNIGPTWAKSEHDDLPLPNGRRVGDVSTPELNHFLEKLLPAFDERTGRQAALERYAAAHARVFDNAGKEAVKQWHKGAA